MLNHRPFKYLILSISSIVIPLLMTILIIIITGDRISGLKYFAIPSILTVHLYFALTQLETSIVKKIIYGVLAALISIGLTLIPFYFEIELNLDMYGFWDLVVFFTLSTVLSWELLYHFDNLITKDKNTN